MIDERCIDEVCFEMCVAEILFEERCFNGIRVWAVAGAGASVARAGAGASGARNGESRTGATTRTGTGAEAGAGTWQGRSGNSA